MPIVFSLVFILDGKRQTCVLTPKSDCHFAIAMHYNPDGLVYHPVLVLGYDISCTTLRVVGITSRRRNHDAERRATN